MQLLSSLEKQKLITALEEESSLESAILYGQPETLLLISKRTDTQTLTQLAKAIQPLTIPIKMFTRDELRESADVFPMEFLDAKTSHERLVGEDMMSQLSIDSIHLRHECEFYLRSHVLKLREGAMRLNRTTFGLVKQKGMLIQESFPAFITAFKWTHYLVTNENPPVESEDVVKELCLKLNLDPTALCDILTHLDDPKYIGTQFDIYLEMMANVVTKINDLAIQKTV